MRQKSLGFYIAMTVGASFFTLGCDSMGGRAKVKEGKADQGVTEDGTAYQQRTRTRETASGATVQETERRERKVIDPGPATKNADPRKVDPGAPASK